MDSPALTESLPSTPAMVSRVSRWNWRGILFHAAVWICLIDISAIAIKEGFKLRRNMWEQTESIRFVGDVRNAFDWAQEAIHSGEHAHRPAAIQIYDDLVTYGRPYWQSGGYRLSPNSPRELIDYGLDYPPLRMAIVVRWVEWTREKFPTYYTPYYSDAWQPDYEFTRPMLWINNGCELASAIAIFLIVRLWVVRGNRPPSPSPILSFFQRILVRTGLRQPRPPAELAVTPAARWPYRGFIPGLIGALLFWFNPAILFNAHGWPQWDVWIMPFFLYALLLACLDWWFTAGLLLAVGILIKGQLLWAAPIFVLWPLFAGNVRGLMRVLIGVLFGTAVSVAPWMLRQPESAPAAAFLPPAYLWLTAIFVAGLLVAPVLIFLRKPWWLYPIVAAVAMLLMIRPFFHVGGMPLLKAGLVAAMLLAAARFLPRRDFPHLWAGALAAAAFMSVNLYDGSMAWYKVGFEYGSRKYQMLYSGGTSNLGTLLQERYSWHYPEEDFQMEMPFVDVPRWLDVPAWFGYHAPFQVTLKNVMTGAFGLCLLLCSIGAAVHSRRNDPRFLVAICAPWVIFFAVMPQMHDRYLVWAVGATALMVAVGTGMTLLHLLLTALCWLMIAWNMLRQPQMLGLEEWWPMGHRVVLGVHTDIAWVVLLIAAIFLAVAMPFGGKRCSAL